MLPPKKKPNVNNQPKVAIIVPVYNVASYLRECLDSILTQTYTNFTVFAVALQCDAIVNAANSGMTGCYVPGHRCIDNCIHTFAGVQLRSACARLMAQQGHEEPTGQAKLTPAFNLPCRYVLHTVGPIVTGRVTARDRALLASCYRACLTKAAEAGLESIAFCCISTGVFCFPNEDAAEIAVQTVKEFLQTPTTIKKVIFNVFKDLACGVRPLDKTVRFSGTGG